MRENIAFQVSLDNQKHHFKFLLAMILKYMTESALMVGPVIMEEESDGWANLEDVNRHSIYSEKLKYKPELAEEF